jgi:hypothetical protein
MSVMNTLGLAFLGAGSEWFWTALTGMVTAITFIAIWRQLRLQASASAREQLDTLQAEYYSERMDRIRVLAYQGAIDGNLDIRSPAWESCDFWDKVGALARGGHLHMDILGRVLGGLAVRWWSIMGPEVVRVREVTGDPVMYTDFEWLAALMIKTRPDELKWTGRPVTVEDLELAIHAMHESIALAEACRAVRA